MTRALSLAPPICWLIIPSGGVWTTAGDMARYLRFRIGMHAIWGAVLGTIVAYGLRRPAR